MKTIQTAVGRLSTSYLLIGFESENDRTQVRIDASEVFAEYPHATPTLCVRPPVGDAYPVIVETDGDAVVWTITASVLSFIGEGEIQLTFYKDEVVCKSAISKIRVLRSLQVEGDMPGPIEQWVDMANEKLTEMDAAMYSIDAMDATATTLPEGSQATARVIDVDDHKRIELGIPKGDTGEKGDKGDKGDAYVLTEADKEEIAGIAEEHFSAEVKGYRDDAVAAKNRAEEILTAVSGSTQQAAASATEAGRQAQASAQSAQASAAAQQAAEQARDGAVQAKTQAEQARDAALGVRDALLQARDDAVAAKTAAQAAQTGAEAARTGAETAQGNAQQSAQAAAQSATQAAQSAQAAQTAVDSIQIATVAETVEYLGIAG